MPIILNNLTTKETLDLRIKCVEIFVPTTSRLGLEKELVFTLGDRLWHHITQDAQQKTTENTKRPKTAKQSAKK